MTLRPDNEIDRIEKILSGQMVYFSDLIRDYQNFVYLTAIKIVSNTMDAEEIAQDVFVKVYRNLKTFRAESKFTTWLYKITYHSCLDFIKNKQKDFERSVLSHDETINSIKTEAAKESNISEEMSQIIENFPLKQKMVMTLFYLQNFSYIEISDIMNESISNVKTLLFRGRNDLKAQLSENYKESAI